MTDDPLPAPATGRLLTAERLQRLAALSSLFKYLCERNAVTHNPVKGVKRPPVDGDVVAAMEEVLDVYEAPLTRRSPWWWVSTKRRAH
jgi:hypothetical protein